MSGGKTDDLKRRRQLVQDASRAEDVEIKHERVRELLKSTGGDALLLQDPVNIAWMTAGADLTRSTPDNCQTSLFITEDARLVATNAVDSTLIFEREVFGLGFQLKQREWFQPHSALIDDLCRGRKVISDSGYEGTRNATRRIAKARLPLTRLEVDRLRKLSQVATYAVEVSANNIRSGTTEAEVAGEISHRLLKRTITPVRIQVCADGRNERFRHWAFGESPIDRCAVVSCTARRWGLHSAVTRTVCLGDWPLELWEAHQRAVLVHATGMYFSKHDEPLKDVWQKVKRIYEKFGLGCEWQLADQADVLGYRPSEVQLTPDSDFVLQTGMPVFWHPSVGPALMGDTVLITKQGFERLTDSAVWPKLHVKVKGVDVECPGILKIQTTLPPTTGAQVSPIQQDSPFASHSFEVEPAGRMDSVWELELTSDRSIFDEEDSPFSEESVLE
ncbi:MAG: M24 family metallopeptidase [Planctomyces sp.]|nr:M24 family metallopeptidase [Planctomyces sp.]